MPPLDDRRKSQELADAVACVTKSDGPEPVYNDYQLLGDSIFVRFSKSVMDLASRMVNGSSTVGFCVSGQRIKQLTKRIKESDAKLKRNVIILIGTNDLLRGNSTSKMMRHFDNLITLLRLRGNKEIVILTLPLIPKFALMKSHWKAVLEFNTFLKTKHSPADSIYVIDIFMHFVKQNMWHSFTTIKEIVEMEVVSPKRKSKDVFSPTSKRKKQHYKKGLMADDTELTPFGRYINKVNQREWEDNLVSSGDEDGYVSSINPCIDKEFLNQLKVTLDWDKIEDLPSLGGRTTLCPTTPPTISSPYYYRSPNYHQQLHDTLKEIVELARKFVRLDCFELYYGGGGQRFDLIHPNHSGLAVIRGQIEAHFINRTFRRERCSSS